MRDISNIDHFMKKIDKDSLSPIKDVEDSAVNSSGSDKTPKRKVIAPYVILKKKLKDLATEFLNAKIQEGHHSSVIDARTALALYRMYYEEIEMKLRTSEALRALRIKKVSEDNIVSKIVPKFAEMKVTSEWTEDSDKNEHSDFGSEDNQENVEGSTQVNSESLCNMLKSTKKQDAQRSQSIKDIEYLMKVNSQIFNITPPNAKIDDKFK